jgi:hypothetical protein
MIRKTPLFSGLLFLLAPLALAQDEYKIELTPYVGYTTSGGVRVNPVDIGDGRIVDRITPTSGVSFGVGFDYSTIYSANMLLSVSISASSKVIWKVAFKVDPRRGLRT